MSFTKIVYDEFYIACYVDMVFYVCNVWMVSILFLVNFSNCF